MTDIIHTLQQTLRLGSQISVILKTGHVIEGRLFAISTTSITVDVGTGLSVIAAELIGYCGPALSPPPSPPLPQAGLVIPEQDANGEQPSAEPGSQASSPEDQITRVVPHPENKGTNGIASVLPTQDENATNRPPSAPSHTSQRLPKDQQPNMPSGAPEAELAPQENGNLRPSNSRSSTQAAEDSPNPRILAGIAQIDARFSVHLTTSRLEPLPFIELLPHGDIEHIPYTLRKQVETAWDRARQKYQHAVAIKEPSRFNQIVFNLRQILDIEPRLWQAHYNIGCLYLALEANTEAKKYFACAAEISAATSCQYNLATASLRSKDSATAYRGLTNFFGSESPSTQMPAWYTLVNLGKERAEVDYLETAYAVASQRDSEQDLRIILETVLFLLHQAGLEDGTPDIMAELLNERIDLGRSVLLFRRWLSRFTTGQATQERSHAAPPVRSPLPMAAPVSAPKNQTGRVATQIPRLEMSKAQIRAKLEEAQRFAQTHQFNFALAAVRQVLEQDPGHEAARTMEQEFRGKERLRTLPSGTGPYRLAKEAEQIEGDPTKAERFYRQAIETADRYESAVKDLALLLSRANRDEETINLLLQHKGKFRNQVPLLQVLTVTYQKIGRHQDAIPYLRSIAGMTQGERHLEVLRRLAISCLKVEDYTEAEDTLRTLLSLAPNDASAQELLESLRRARQTGTRGNLEQLILTMELFVESRSKLSDFITYYLDRCSYEGATAESRAANKYTETDVDYIDRRAHSHGDKLPKERATYYLSAAKILMDLGVSDGGRAKAYLRNFCAAMGDFSIVEKRDPEVSRTFYAEAFLVTPEWVDQLSVKLTQFIMLYYAEPADILRPRLPLVEVVLERALSIEPIRVSLIDGLLYLSSLNSRVAKEVLERSRQRAQLLEQVLGACQQALGEVGPLPSDPTSVAQLWNRGMQLVGKRIQTCVDELSYLLSQAETLDALTDQIERLRALALRLPGALDRRRVEAISGLLERVLDFTQQRAYLELESLANTIRNRVRELIEQMEGSPTKLSLEFLIPYVSKLGTTVEAHFGQVRLASEPDELETELLIEAYTPDLSTAEIECHILIRNPDGKSPASNIVLEILDPPEHEYDIVQRTTTVSEALAGGQRVTCLVPVKITAKATAAEVFTLRYRLSYNTRGGRRIETEPTAQSVGLSKKGFDEISPNPYAPYAQGSIVDNEEMFYGRDDLLRRLTELVHGSPTLKSLVIYGQKRTGKSSVLYHLERTFKPPVIPIRFSLGEIISDLTFPNLLYLIIQEIDTRLSRLRVDEPTGPSRPSYDDICRLPELTFHEYLKRVQLHLVDALSGQQPRLMLLIDEFSYLYTAIASGKVPASFMKSWKAILEKRYFGCVLVGQQVMVPFMRQFQNEFQVAEAIPLSYLDDDAAKDLIVKPIQIQGTRESRYRGPALPLLLDLTAGSPYYIQIFCNRLVQYMNRKRKRVVSDADIERVKVELVAGNGRLDESAFDNLMSVGDQQVEPMPRRDIELALRAVAAGTRRQRFCDPVASIAGTTRPAAEILTELVDREVLAKEGGARYRIRVGLFKEWLLASQ